ncbi:MAG TPA: rhamnogalacturonan acetylesterase [Flavitalea sp.]|nr:rhamnogalacturonan acetylesterase [Flavitalea sp.]
MKKLIRYSFLLLISGIFLTAFIQNKKRIVIYSIGDSTMADYDISRLSEEYGGENYPLRGWMMKLSPFFKETVIIRNIAKSGRSSKSFRNDGLWDTVIRNIRPGDYVFIQFGHNDQKPDTARHTDPPAFRENLLNYINEAREKGGRPVLFTSIVRRAFDEKQVLIDTHGEYVTVVRSLAAETHTPLIDLNKMTGDLVEALGPEDSKSLFLHIPPGVFAKLPEGRADDTHLSQKGALEVSRMAVEGIRKLKLPLAKQLKRKADPDR